MGNLCHAFRKDRMSTTEKKCVDVLTLGAKEKFQQWITERGGVVRWCNVNLSNPDAGDTFTPLRTAEGVEYQKPHWSVEKAEVHTDLRDFRFIKELKEVKRVKVAVRMGSQGFTLKLTLASTRRVRAACTKIKEKHGVAPCYHFEGAEAVIEVPVFED